ncbi:MAG: DUF1559 domain-containing protein [Planctomycetota bacterium]
MESTLSFRHRSIHSSDRVVRRRLISTRRHAFTLVELLVVIAIIGVIISLTLPAIQSMRERSRRTGCEQNMRDIGTAISAHYVSHGYYPIGCLNEEDTVQSQANSGMHHSWTLSILPGLDMKPAYDQVDFETSVYADKHQPLRMVQPPVFLCPSYPTASVSTAVSSYAGNNHDVEAPIASGNNGVFLVNRAVTDDDISDGLDYTIFIGEKVQPDALELGWMSGTNATLRNTGTAIGEDLARVVRMQPVTDKSKNVVGGFGSFHPGGALVMLGQGQTRFLTTSTDLRILRQMGNRADGELPIQWRPDNPRDPAAAVETTPADAEESLVPPAEKETDEADRAEVENALQNGAKKDDATATFNNQIAEPERDDA